MEKVELETKQWAYATRVLDKCLPWKSCSPFVDNRNSKLIHRPRAVAMMRLGNTHHLAVRFMCGNAATGTDKFTFLDSDLPDGKFICARCEAVAVSRGLPSSDEMLGKHVHTGKYVPVQACHKP